MNNDQQIFKILKNNFQIQLFKASLKNLGDKNNVLRYNNFCYSIRELSRHFLYSLSPDEFICRCSWFVVETLDGKSSRSQKIKFAIQGGLNDKFLRNIGYDVNDLNIIIKEINSTINSLNKYTHINPDTFNLAQEFVEEKSEYVLKTFEKFVTTIDLCREGLITLISEHIEQSMIDNIINSSLESIDSLAPQYLVNGCEVYEYYIDKITDAEIVVKVYGILNVNLEYGFKYEIASDDGVNINQTFPFETKVKYVINEKFPLHEYSVDKFDVDITDWFE